MMLSKQFAIFKILLFTFFITALSTPVCAQFYNGTQMSFGKNRVQYTDFEWKFMQFKRFDTYYYKGGKELAEFTGRTADKELVEIEKLFDYSSDERLQFIIFNKLSDLKQTNIGLEADAQLNNTGGITKIVGNKILIYFDGDHEHLKQQIRGGIARVLFDQLMYGGSVKDRLQSSLLLNIPDWYINGLSQWVAVGWTITDDNRMRDGILAGKYKRLNNLAATDADFAGQSVWNFVEQSYGKSAIANMLYMARLNRNIESGFNFVLGTNLKQTTTAWLTYYNTKYLNSDNGREQTSGKPLSIKSKPKRIVNQFKLSPDGSKAAYVINDLGKYRVYIYDLKRGKSKRIAKGGYKSLVQKTDDSFPLLAWHPAGKSLTMIKEKKGIIWLDNYNPKSRKTDHSKLLYFEKINDFSYSDDGQNLVMSANQKGQSDIFVWNIRGRSTTQITKDLYDDLQPRFTNNSQRIIFTSNRVNDTLGAGDFYTQVQKKHDVFLYDYSSRSDVLARLTNSPNVSESQPMELDSGRYIFLSDYTGIRNRMLATLDSTISFVDTVEHYRFIVREFAQTNYARNIDQQDVNYKHTKYATKFLNKGYIQFFVNPLPEAVLSTNREIFSKPNITNLKTPVPSNNNVMLITEVKTPEVKTANPDTVNIIDINNYAFQSEFKPKPKSSTTVVLPDSITFDNSNEVVTYQANPLQSPLSSDSVVTYRLPKQRNYDLAFSSKYFVAQLDNNLLSPTYQAYTGGGAFYFDPGLNGLFLVGINDLMDDYKMVGGIRLSGNFNSNEYYVSFENLKKRFDKTISFFRQAREDFIGYAPIKVVTQELSYKIKYPFNDVSSLRGTVGFRTDRGVVKSVDYPTLIFPNEYQYWGTANLSYVFDNTINLGVNLLQGTRAKVFAEVFHQVDQKNTLLSVVGVDFRHYTKISKNIVLATRFAASTSMGDLKLIYYLGSVDNAFAPSDNFNPSIRIDQTQNYAFQAVATNMRGFRQNIRNGNSFALMNNELRIPIFQYLSPSPIKSDFFRNFMVVPFYDVGTAWTSTSPYSDKNNLNLDIITSGPLVITVNKNTDPIVMGYGFGLHSRLLGYFMRADWGWSYADGEFSKKSLFNFSLSLDF